MNHLTPLEKNNLEYLKWKFHNVFMLRSKKRSKVEINSDNF